MSRELTREEKAAIRRLVISLCANYDREQGCLPLDCDCYMLGKCWTGPTAVIFARPFCPLILCWRPPSRTRGRPRTVRLVLSVAKPISPLPARRIAPRLAVSLARAGLTAAANGNSAKTRAHVRNLAEKSGCLQGFPAPKRGPEAQLSYSWIFGGKFGTNCPEAERRKMFEV